MPAGADKSVQGTDEAASNKTAFSPPTISLPKGGGAIRGIGEKFAANPVTGTGSMTVPIATSPGRSGFGPQLSLSYDSGSGNGPFGFGWSLSLPAITRKTDKGLPQYRDVEESDVFILSGAEDLVPEFKKDAQGDWVLKDGRHVIHDKPRTVDGVEYVVRRYRPRIEGLFARIERWTNTTDATDVFWRSISKDNITTWYGRSGESRIADPADASRIFSWLICQSHDDKGNVVVYGYRREDSARIFEDSAGNELAKAHERNRTDESRSAQRYLKRIRYGNRSPYFPELKADSPWPEPEGAGAEDGSGAWHFEVVLDYGDHQADAPMPNEQGTWPARPDPFSSYRSGFEVRTYRICQRVLMFHHFEHEEVGVNCLVRSTDFSYSYEEEPTSARNPVYTFLRGVTQSGYRREQPADPYLKRSLPELEFEYTLPQVQDDVRDVDPESLENLPVGLDGSAYQWTDLHGEGIPGILTEQAGAWFYKRNLSPIADPDPSKPGIGKIGSTVELAPLELVASKPNLALAGGGPFMDLAGDGQPDLVVLDGAAPGLYEHDGQEGWQPFRPFTSRLNRNMQDPNLKFVDLDGDGHADVLITENDAFVWHASLAEAGFAPAVRVHQALDEEKGPRLVFADGTQSIYLADLSGDGLTDLVRIRNGEVCYWPNLGYCRFGAKVTMDNAPWFDNPDQFDQKRIRLADIDGSGTTDIIYLHRDGVRLYFNQSGNGWSQPRTLTVFPRVDDVVSIVPTDLLGNGTACLVWSSPLPGDARRPMRYVNLMGDRKPHLLVKTINNLGAETQVDYAPSTKFYLLDKRDGKPWITRLPFPVHVVEKVTTYDRISRNIFCTRYAYHHGYFDGEEREFRGFGMVEQWDTEAFSSLAPIGGEGWGEGATNIAAASHVPPVHTKTWFHTGVYLGRDHVSDYFAGLLDATDKGEYFREPGLTDDEARGLLLPDTVLPDSLTLEEEREACRALKGSMLRQEVYADDADRLDATPEQVRRARAPYTVTEQNFTIRAMQPRGGNRHAVFFTHACEALSYHYERNPADPCIQHALTLEVDTFGNVLKRAAIGYGRRKQIRVVDDQGNVQLVPNPCLTGLDATDQAKQITPLLTYTENRVTKDHDTDSDAIDRDDVHRAPLPCEAVTFELTGYPASGAEIGPGIDPAQRVHRYLASDFVEPDPSVPGRLRHKFTAPEVPYEAEATGSQRRRPIEWLRTLYRADDLSGLLPLGAVQPMALPGETYKLAFTPGLIAQVYQRSGQLLLPTPADVLSIDAAQGVTADRGGYVDLDANGHWWIPSGRSFYHPDDVAAPVELAEAHAHFFLPRRYRDPFGNEATVKFDGPADPAKPRYDLMIVETSDALGNRVTVDANDYRVLQPRLVSDPNRNETEVAFDALGMVVGTAVMGKPLPAPVEGDTLTSFVADFTQAQLDIFFDAADPHATASALLKDATTRIVYDLDRFRRTRQANPNDPTKWQPACAATLARETHASSPLSPQGPKIQLSFSYSDGFGREIQKKIQAEPGPLDVNEPQAPVVDPRWVGSGWTIFNNKGKPVRQYEPFFSPTHQFEFAKQVGVSPILFYDPAERVIGTLHPNHTYEKVVFDPWQQATWDVNDTAAPRNEQTGDPRTDPDVAGYVKGYFDSLPPAEAQSWQTWFQQRQGNALGVREQQAATKTEVHADTPTTAHFDALGRAFLTVAHNRFTRRKADGTTEIIEEKYPTRVDLDIEGNQREVRDAVVQNGDALGRIVMRYDYDMLGNRIHQASMEAGERWTLNDVASQPIRAWDSRGHTFRAEYDALRRPVRAYVLGADLTAPDADPANPTVDPSDPNKGGLFERTVYGEAHPDSAEGAAHSLNLRGKVYQQFDSAGVVTNHQYDYKGNLLHSSRGVGRQYKMRVNWSGLEPLLSAAPLDVAGIDAKVASLVEAFATQTTYDALNRPTTITTPDLSVARPTYNAANLLERVEVNLRGAAAATAFVTNVDYNAKGQRTLIEYGNGVKTTYEYDRLTFRPIHLLTKRNPGAFPDDCPNPPPSGWPGCQVQNLSYTYDPAGNITYIRDDAQQTIYFRNKRVEPSNDYTYDAIYRLIEATGREHLGQVGGSPIPHSYNDAPRVGIEWSKNDGNAMGTYRERYTYDEVGNFKASTGDGSPEGMKHEGLDPANPGWLRRYNYEEDSLTEPATPTRPAKKSNRLTGTRIGDGPLGKYTYDAHGNMLQMPHLQIMQWDFKDQLRMTQRQAVNSDDADGVLHQGERTYYVYDATGQRARKVTERANGTLKKERIYLGGCEIYRSHSSSDAGLIRETLHVMDDKQRIALVETRNEIDDNTSKQLTRYQFGNHLGSASLEMDHRAQVISYEEYAPCGSSSYQAVRSHAEAPKRLRYTGKERDTENGLYYHGARYYAAWLARWTSCDPAGTMDGPNLYSYVRNNPVRLVDVTGRQGAPTEPDYGLETMQKWTIENAVKLGLNPPTPEEQRAQREALGEEGMDKRATTLGQPKPGEALFCSARHCFYAQPPPAADPFARDPPEVRAVRKWLTEDHPALGTLLEVVQAAGGLVMFGQDARSALRAAPWGFRLGKQGPRVPAPPLLPPAQAGGAPSVNAAEVDAAAPGQRVFYGGTGPKWKLNLKTDQFELQADMAVLQTSGRRMAWESPTNASYVRLAAEVAGRDFPGAELIIGSGVHGKLNGALGAAEPQFIQQDLRITLTRPGTPLINVATPSGLSFFCHLEAANDGSYVTMRAWCYSARTQF